MKSGGYFNLPSVTVESTDINKFLHKFVPVLQQRFNKEVLSTLTLTGQNYKEEYDISSNTIPDIKEFHDGLRTINIEMKVQDEVELSLNLSALEANPFGPDFTKISVESKDSTFVAGLIDEIRRFFNKRRNFHCIFHTWGIWSSIFLSAIFASVIYINAKKFGYAIPVEFKLFVLYGCFISLPLKFVLRWIFPYVYFKGENKFRDITRFVIQAVVFGVIGNLAYSLFTGEY